jgi:hypothetical protein
VRIKSRWHKKERPKSPEESASALAFIAWRIAVNAVQEMEKAGFQLVEPPGARFDVVSELLAFLTQAADRLAYEYLEEEERQRLIPAFALRLADTLDENASDLLGPGDYREAFITKVNGRAEDYAEMAFDPEAGPGYGVLRYLGDRIRDCVAGEDTRWVLEQVVEIEGPNAFETLHKGFQDLMGA